MSNGESFETSDQLSQNWILAISFIVYLFLKFLGVRILEKQSIASFTKPPRNFLFTLANWRLDYHVGIDTYSDAIHQCAR